MSLTINIVVIMKHKRSKGSSNRDLVLFYKLCLTDEVLQNRLLPCVTRDDFCKVACELGMDRGLYFTFEDVHESVSNSKASNAFDDVVFNNAWEHKIVSMGWAPLGYVR